MQRVQIEKLVPGGQGMARLDDGRVCFIWGVLPGERVEIDVFRKKKSFCQGQLLKVLEPSPQRIEPVDEAYLSTSPWQIMDFDAEQAHKHELIQESFAQQGIDLPEFDLQTDGRQYGYRNKMEFSFWWTEPTDRIDLAFYRRGSSLRVPVEGSSLTTDGINIAARDMMQSIRDTGLQARQLKSLLLRCDQRGRVAAALFVKDKDIEIPPTPASIAALEVWYSSPKSPASVPTTLLQGADVQMMDTIMGRDFSYDVYSFFQVNLPMYQLALNDIKSEVAGEEVVDMYSGTGTIGLSVSDKPILVELDELSAAYAKVNAADEGQVVVARSERALEHIDPDKILILDPPRAGLQSKLVKHLGEVQPAKIIYMSCEASTHARDIKLLAELGYRLTDFKAYNFFPRTPHTETLAILELDSSATTA